MNYNYVLQDRKEAGKKLAALLQHYRGADTVIMAMPRGGVVVAFEIAQALQAPLDVIVARKIGAPDNPEYAIGAIAPGDIKLMNPEVQAYLDFDSPEVEKIVAHETKEMERRIKLYRGDRKTLNIKGKNVIIVDDGVATGQTALASILAIKKMQPKKIILAVGVCADDSAEMLQQYVDEFVCLAMPEPFYGVGMWYKDFSQTTDDEVIELLELNFNSRNG